MKPLILFALPLLFCATCFAQSKSSLDKLDVDEILSNRRILDNYMKCILKTGPCTAEGREIRSIIPEAILTSCSRCSNAQAKIVKKASYYLMKNKPDEWEIITKHFDPDGKYRESFNKFVVS